MRLGRDVLIRALEAVDLARVYAWRDPLAFVEPMDWSVSNAMYWQPPHEEDVVAADPGVVAALRPGCRCDRDRRRRLGGVRRSTWLRCATRAGSTRTTLRRLPR
jgi:hypothetical protein